MIGWLFGPIINHTFSVELLLAAVIYMLPLPKRNGCRTRFFAGTLAYFTGIWLYNRSIISLSSTDAVWEMAYTMRALFVLLAVGWLIWLSCEVVPVNALHCVAFAYTTQHFAYCLYRYVFQTEAPAAVNQYTLGYIAVYVAVYVSFYFIFAKRILLAKNTNMGLRFSVSYTVSTLVFIRLLSDGSWMFVKESSSFDRFVLIYPMLCCICLLFIQIYLFRALYLQNELNLQQRLWQESKAQYELSRENIALINQKCHDLKHQIGALRSMTDGAERESKLKELEQSVMIYDSIVKTGNSTIDTVLTEKSLVCERNEIVLTCIADGECLKFMDTIDLYTIFGNLLDNAIESVRKLGDPKKRVISVSIFSKADLVLIQCENYYEGELTFVNGLPKSTKASSGYHGYGINGIKQTAEKYGGFLTLETGNHIFLLRITIPLQNG